MLFDFMLVFRRLEGFGGSDRGPGVADLADYPGFAKQQVWNFPRNQQRPKRFDGSIFITQLTCPE